jgi:hypothetical protein
MLTGKDCSADISALAAALTRAQGQIQEAERDSDNPALRSRYASLASVWRACRRALADNQLSVAQFAETTEGQLAVRVRSLLMHSSGQWLASTLDVRPSGEGAQAVGMAITYCRRYALAALVGVAVEDEEERAPAARGAEAPVAPALLREIGAPPAPSAEESLQNTAALSKEAVRAAVAGLPPKVKAANAATHLAQLLAVFPSPYAVLATAWQDARLAEPQPGSPEAWGALPAPTAVVLYDRIMARCLKFIGQADKEKPAKAEPPAASVDAFLKELDT